MPRRPSNKRSNNFQEELRKQVKRYNAKIDRTARKSPEIAGFLPRKLSAKELKQQIKTPADMRLLRNAVDRLFKDGALAPVKTPTGVETTRYAINELKLGVKRINRARAAERAKINPSTEAGTMGSVQVTSLLPKQFNPNKLKKSDWEAFVNSVEKQSRPSYNQEKIDKYKESYLKAIVTLTGSKTNKFYRLIQRLPANFIYDRYYDDNLLQIGFIYDPLNQSVIINAAYNRWVAAIREVVVQGREEALGKALGKIKELLTDAPDDESDLPF